MFASEPKTRRGRKNSEMYLLSNGNTEPETSFCNSPSLLLFHTEPLAVRLASIPMSSLLTAFQMLQKADITNLVTTGQFPGSLLRL